MNFEKFKPQILKLAQDNDDIEVLWLYAFYAKGTAHERSEIDLAVVKTWVDNVLSGE